MQEITEPPDALAEQSIIDHQLMLLIEASSTLLASPNSPHVLETILNLAKRFVDADAYAVWRKQTDADEWRVVAVDGLSESYPRSAKESSNSGTRLPSGAVAIECVENSPLVGFRAALYRAEGIRSMLTMPLSIHGEIGGTIVFYYRSPTGSAKQRSGLPRRLGILRRQLWEPRNFTNGRPRCGWRPKLRDGGRRSWPARESYSLRPWTTQRH